MAPISIVHTTVKQDYSGSGAVAANQELVASDWNDVHFVLNAGGGISIVSDGGTPPTLTIAVSSTEPTATTFGGSIIPTTDNVFDVGSLPLRWRNIFVAGTISVGNSLGYISTTADGAQNGSPSDIVMNSGKAAGQSVGLNVGGDIDINANAGRVALISGSIDIFVDGNTLAIYPVPADTVAFGGLGAAQHWGVARVRGSNGIEGYAANSTNKEWVLNTGSGLGLNATAGDSNFAVTLFASGANGALQFGPVGASSPDVFVERNSGNLRFLAGGNRIMWDGTAFSPVTDAARDLGIQGTQRWRNAFYSGSASSGTFITNSTFQFGSAAQGAILTYDLTKGVSGSFIIENTSLVELVRIDNSTGKFSSAFTVSAATGFQTNSLTMLAFGTSAIVTNAAHDQVNPSPDNTVAFGVSGKRWSQVITGLTGTLVHDGTIIRSSLALLVSAGSGFQTNASSALLTTATGLSLFVGSFGLPATTFGFNSGLATTAGTVSAANGFQTNGVTSFTTGSTLSFSVGGGSSNVNFNAFEVNPNADNTSNLGDPAKRWANVYAVVVSAGNGFQTNSGGYIAGSANVGFQAYGVGDGSKKVQFVHDGSNAQFSMTGAGNMNFSLGTGTVYNFANAGAEIRITGVGATVPLLRILNNGFETRLFTANPAGQNFHIEGTVSVGGHLTPDADNTYDIGGITGANGAVVNERWRNGYFAGTVSVGGNLIFTTAGSIIRSTGNQIKIDSSQLIPFSDNATQLGAATSRWTSSWFAGTTSTGTLQIGAGVVTAFNNRATAVNGVLAIVAEGDQTGASAANASLAAFTVGATNGVFKVGGDVDVTAISGATVTLQAAYTDWSGNARTATLVSSTALGDSPANDKTIMAQNGTAITLSTTLAGGTATWNVAAWIGWVK